MASTTTSPPITAPKGTAVVPQHRSVKKIHYPFWLGGSASCMAAVVTHPLDLVKVRLQTAATLECGTKPKMVGTFLNIFRHEGFLALYSGLSASLLRQATYSTTRFGAYEELKSRFAHEDGSKMSFGTLIFMACASGWLGGLAGNPADVLNVRMQNDLSLPPSKRRNYRNAINGLIRMSREEGISSLFRGVWPNTLRAALMTASQLATYDQAKMAILSYTPLTDGLGVHFLASLWSGLVATTVCSPVDVVKTRVMSAHHGDGTGVGIWELVRDTTRREGWGWMWRGWVPSFVRLGPQTILTFVALEQHKKAWRWFRNVEEESKI